MGSRNTRPISWIRAARRDFEKFPAAVQETVVDALTVAAEGAKADIAKPLHGLGSGVFEVVVQYRTDAFRSVYAVQLEDSIWVVHAFQKKSTQGGKTPKKEIDLIRERLKRIKKELNR
ncbi:MAG: type II toxin-antitoxin system RelE/ParE family toxin [Bryobacterales bacterium]